MIQNCLFDLYGTLIDIETDECVPSLWKRMALLLSLQGATYRDEELRAAYSYAIEQEIISISDLNPTVEKDHIEPDILRVFASLYIQKGIHPSADMIRDTAVFFRTLSLRHLRLYPDAMKVLQSLRQRGMGVYLLSNAQAAFTVPELNKLGLVSLFDDIVLSSDVGVKKPNKAIFDHILSKHHLRGNTCVMVGNDVETDMNGAASAGMEGIYIHTKQSPGPRRPLPSNCREIQRLSELLYIFPQ